MSEFNVEKVVDRIVREINRAGKLRDAVYLDTNAWSTLAKGRVACEPLQEWLKENGCYLWMARFQLAELARDSRIAAMLADLLRKLPVVMLDRAQDELNGAPWHKVTTAIDEYIHLETDEQYSLFLDKIMRGPILETRGQLDRDKESFREWLEKSLSSISPQTERTWLEFPTRVESWTRAKCLQNKIPINEDALRNPLCYIGLKLSYGVLFVRYFLNRQRWNSSDYLDYLHASDMAYARVVVTEKNLAECLRQLNKKARLTAPDQIEDLGWLNDPFSGNQPPG